MEKTANTRLVRLRQIVTRVPYGLGRTEPKPMRYAVYFAPQPNDPLTQIVQEWLGRDAFIGRAVAHPEIGGLTQQEIAQATSSPRKYGFHATIVAPFRLAEEVSERDLVDAFDGFCANQTPFELKLAVNRIGSFLALTEEKQSRPLDALQRAATEYFHRFRAPLTDREIEARDPARLTARQRELLERWDYPYVMDEFRFHMTLTGGLQAEVMRKFEPVLRRHFASVLARPVVVDSLAIFQQPEIDGPFIVKAMRGFACEHSRRFA